MGISQNQWNEWLITVDKTYKQSALKKKVLDRTETGVLSLGDFKRLARRVYASKYFRPRDSWCRQFIVRENLENRVDFRSTE